LLADIGLRVRQAWGMYPIPRTHLSLLMGFTLVELLLVLSLLIALGLVAQPIYQNYVERGYQLQAQADLLACAQRLHRSVLGRHSYLGHADTNGDGVGDGDIGPIAVTVCPHLESSLSPYVFTIRAASDAFELTATPRPASDNRQRGALSLDHVGVRRWDANGDGHYADDELQWPLS
jgi:Tfp pilus assembly protein PilE